MVVVVRAERCEDNSPNGEICRAGVLYEVGSVWCEGVLHSTQKLKKYSLTYSVLYFWMASDLSFFSVFIHYFFVSFLFPSLIQVCFIGI